MDNYQILKDYLKLICPEDPKLIDTAISISKYELPKFPNGNLQPTVSMFPGTERMYLKVTLNHWETHQKFDLVTYGWMNPITKDGLDEMTKTAKTMITNIDKYWTYLYDNYKGIEKNTLKIDFKSRKPGQGLRQQTAEKKGKNHERN